MKLNKNGQALIEAISLSLIILPLIIFIMNGLISLTTKIALDDVLEQHLLCRIQENAECQTITLARLKKINLTDINFRDLSLESFYQIQLKAKTKNNYEIHIQRQIEFNKKI